MLELGPAALSLLPTCVNIRCNPASKSETSLRRKGSKRAGVISGQGRGV